MRLPAVRHESQFQGVWQWVSVGDSARTLWIGCLASGAIPYLFLTYFAAIYSSSFMQPSNMLSRLIANGNRLSYALAGAHLVIVLSGLAAVMTRWLIIDRRLARADAEAGGTPFK